MYRIDTVFFGGGGLGFERVLKKNENIALLIVFKYETATCMGMKSSKCIN